MSLPYGEGEVFFKRSGLKHPSSGFDADNQSSFYEHALVETVWNNRFCSQSEHPESFKHRYARLNKYDPESWGPSYYTWSYQRCHFTNERNGNVIRRRVALQNNTNASEIRDYEKGGPNKVVIMPVKLGSEKYMFMELTAIVRAVYFPLAYQCDENFGDLCSYLMVDFRKRGGIAFRTTDDVNTTLECSNIWGLTKDAWPWTMGFDLQGLYRYLTLPRQMRNPDFGLYQSLSDGDELIWLTHNDGIGDTKSETKVYFDRHMDLAKVVASNLGVDLVWTPYESSSWAVKLFTSLVEFRHGIIPIIGPLLAVEFSITITAITDPDFFRSDNILELPLDILEAVLDSASESKKFMVEGFHFATPDSAAAKSAPTGNPKTNLREVRNTMLKARLTRAESKPNPMYVSRLEGLDQSSATGAITRSRGEEGAIPWAGKLRRSFDLAF